MTGKAAVSLPAWDDEDTPDWTDDHWTAPNWRSAGRWCGPLQVRCRALGDRLRHGATKRQVTLRIDPNVIDKSREGEPGWQGRMNEALWKAEGL